MAVKKFWFGTRVARVKGKPYDMGKQRGEQLADIIRSNVTNVLSFKKDIPMNTILEEAERFEDAINNKFPEVIDELKGIANGAKIPWDNLSAATLGTIPTRESVIPKEECSCFAATGLATSDGAPILAKNADNRFRHKCLLIAEPYGGNKYVGGCMPWLPGIDDGMNEKGMALSGSASNPLKDACEAYNKRKPLGVPIIYLHGVMFAQCDNVDDALEYLKLSPTGYYGRNVNVIDKKGNIIKAEVSYENYNLEFPQDWFVVSTNHFASKKMNKYGPSADKSPNSYKRYNRLMELIPPQARSGKIDFKFAQDVMRDHKNGPNDSICMHGSLTTWGSFIMQPTAKKVWALLGHPCENEYEPLTV